MNWLIHNYAWVLELLGQHLVIAVSAIVIALVISIPLGRAAVNSAFGRGLVSVVGAMYALPSLALLILVPVIIGTPLRSSLNMVIVLSIYGVAIMAGPCVQAFSGLPEQVLLSADACGYGRLRRWWQIELPLALAVIASAARVLVTSTISLVTVAAFIGISSLGTLLTDGFQRGISAEVITGLVVTIILALLLDGLVALAHWLLSGWRRA